MKQQCTYHPTRTAHWLCPNCGKAFCPECVVKREKAGYSKNELLHFCPKCNMTVSWAGIANIVDPFWMRLPKIFAYPFAPGPLIFMAVITFFSMIFSDQGLVSGLIRFAVMGTMVKYSFAALKHTATGSLRPPAITKEVLSSDFDEVLKQLCIFLFVGTVFGFVTAKAGLALGILSLLFMLLSLPAMIILLVSTRQFFHAINPVLFVSLMFRIGWGYAIMCLFLLLLSGAPATVFHFISPMLPEKLSIFMAVFAENFYTLVSYHLMGCVVLQYHQEIGYEVEHKEFDDPSEDFQQTTVLDPEERVLKEVSRLVQEGNLQDAVNAVEKYLSNSPIKNRMLADRYFELLKMTRQTDKMVGYGSNYLDLLVRENDKAAGVRVFAECKSIKPEFEPTPSALMKIAGWVGETGKPESAIQLYNQLIKNHPQDPATPKAYFRAAQIFQDRLLKPDKCREILHALIQKYPNSEVAPMARKYMEGL
ncbi:MAG: tetratricopeptide repeat protein [Desulfobacteraceae bacterium]|nr:tetratricopeptide repeat protein [Desulfobacteraceae bacterium]MBU4055071.1 tetratricopeptide repeat protein [Pseudomonadota bacterium]